MKAPPAVSGLPATGHLISGRWEIVDRIATGAMGAVYRARDPDGLQVAVKVLHPELAAQDELRRRFRRESSILAALHHPGVVRVLSTGTDSEGRSFTVMELLEGQTLEARLKEGTMSPSELKPLVTQIAGALSAVHEHGVVHGDLKPANVFLADGPQAKLVDFGLSKVYGLERLTRTGEVIGTPIYMAPELLTGDGGIDGRVDTYALGVMLYEALSGRCPFVERNPGKLLFEIVMGKGTPLVDVAPEVSEPVRQVVATAMAASRNGRFEAPADLARAFEHAVLG